MTFPIELKIVIYVEELLVYLSSLSEIKVVQTTLD